MSMSVSSLNRLTKHFPHSLLYIHLIDKYDILSIFRNYEFIFPYKKSSSALSFEDITINAY